MAKKIAVIGAGGKTTALGILARQSRKKRVLITTTTHIFPIEPPLCRECLVDPSPEELSAALAKPGIVCAGSSAKDGKLGILPEAVLNAARGADLILYEADGANGHPLKLHNDMEPVLLAGTDRCLVVAGLSALGKPVSEMIHRYESLQVWEECPQQPVGAPELKICVLETAIASWLPPEKVRILLNQADAAEDLDAAGHVLDTVLAMGYECRIGSLLQAPDFLYSWVTGE